MQPLLPKISIIMPVLNRADTVEKAIKSVLAQRYANIELIILDGGSTDGTLDIIKQYESHLAYWQSERDRGPAHVTNLGIKKSTGDLITIFMADDWYEDGIFQRIAEAYRQYPDGDIYTCAGRIVSYNSVSKIYEPLLTYSTQEEMALTFNNICYGVSAICARFIKKSLYDRIGLFIPLLEDGKNFLTNDKEFLLRAMLANAKDVFVDHLGHTYFAHKESFSFGNNRASNMRHCMEHMYIAKNYLSNMKLTWRQKWFLRRWYNDQSVRLMLYQLLEGQKIAALKTAASGIKHYHLLWAVIGCHTVGKIIVKRFPP